MSEQTRSTDPTRLWERVDRRKWIAVCAVITTLALLSAAQIYLRLKAAGQSPSGFRTVITNLLAWCPWVVVTAVVFRLGNHFPLMGRPLVSEHWRRRAAIHSVAATLTAAAYLAYLTLFWFGFFPERMGRLTSAAYLSAYGTVLGEFFLVAFVGYWLILAADFGMDAAKQVRILEEAAPKKDGIPGKPERQDLPHRLEIRSRGRVRYVDAHEIDWLEAEGSYVRLHVGETSLLHRQTLSSLVEELGESFVRVHRGAAVRLNRVAELRPVSHGEAILRLNTGRELKLSRSYRRQVEPLLHSGSPH